jgi:homogentisate phytyltransferase/homogentisate geranylgeranyltransferase
MACKSGGVPPAVHVELYLHTLIAALACNVFIVGLNQLVDVELDKINKPWLPLAAGTLSRKNGQIIIYTALAVCLGVAAVTSLFLFLLMAVIILIGVAYSVPPIQLKRHHLPAALAITLVRGLMVNIGMFLHFQKTFSGNWQVPGFVWSLTLFIMAFSVAIAWFKDIPDTEGDQQFKVKTLAVLYSRKWALRGGLLLLCAAYIYVIIWGLLVVPENSLLLIIAHGILFVLYLLNYFSARLEDPKAIRGFYIRFWVFFFAEYGVFAVWALL